MAATTALAATAVWKEFLNRPTKTSSNAAAPSKNTTIPDLPNELHDDICHQFLLELYENEGSYAKNEVSLLIHVRAFRKKINTLNKIPGFTASNILAKRNIHFVPTQYLWLRGFPSKIRIGHTIKDIDHDTTENGDDIGKVGVAYPTSEQTFLIIFEQRHARIELGPQDSVEDIFSDI